MLIDTRPFSLSPQELSLRLLTQVKIAATPMTGWGETASNYLRFVFSNESEQRLKGIGEKIRQVTYERR